jgi:ABC-2 type transport system permease protein
MLKLLLKNRLNIILLGYTRDEPKRRAGRIIGTIAGAAIFSLILFYSAKLTSFMLERLGEGLTGTILDIALDYVFAMMFIFIIFTGVASSLYILYSSKDLQLLLSLPISFRTVFVYKYIEALIANSYLFFIVIFPLLISLGLSSQMPIAYYPVMFVIFISVLSIPTSMGVLLGMITVRYVNPKRAREVLAIIGGLLGLGIWLSSQLLSRYIGNVAPEFESMNIESIEQYVLAIFDRPFLKFLPSTWGSNALFNIYNGDYSGFAINFILAVAAAGILAFICITLSKKIYYSGWSSASQAVAGRRFRRARVKGGEYVRGKRTGILSFSGINYLMVKDFKILSRDMRKLLQVFMPVVMILFIFFWTVSGSINERGGIDFFIAQENLFIIFVPLLVAGLINVNISGNNIGGEGLKFWILKISPVHSKRILRTKVVFSSLLTAVLGSVIMIIFYFVYRPEIMYLILGLLLMALFCWGDSVIGTSVGTFFPVFKPSASSKNNISFLGGLLNFIFFALYLLIFSGIIIGVMFLGYFFSWSNMIIFPAILLLEVLIDLVLYSVLINISAYRLSSIEWKF